MQKITTFLFLASTLLIISCADRDPVIFAPAPDLPSQLANYAAPQVQDNFFLDENKYQVSDAGATLGRVLFYDKILSRTNRVSCGSCHLQEAAFADPVRFSEGINGQVLSRHTPGISNAYDDNLLFWDGRSKSLHDLALRPIRNHKEMGLDETEFMIAKIEKAPYYDALFESAYGDQKVTEDRIADALRQFMSSMISGNSRFDRRMAGQNTFTTLEQEGHAIFFGEGRCYQCHNGPDFNQRTFFGGPFGGDWSNTANIGLDVEYADNGVGELDPDRLGEFKIPTLRNIAQSAPYMHDGRFETLEEVVNHYNTGIKAHPNLAIELRDWADTEPASLGLDDHGVRALVAFLHTLTDEQYLTDPKFSDPFDK